MSREPTAPLSTSPTSSVFEWPEIAVTACGARKLGREHAQEMLPLHFEGVCLSLLDMGADLLHLVLVRLLTASTRASRLQTLARCAGTCSALRQACDSEAMWQHLCSTGFRVMPNVPPPSGWRNLYHRLRDLVSPAKWSVASWGELDNELALLQAHPILAAARLNGYRCIYVETSLERASPDEAARRGAVDSELYTTQPCSIDMLGDTFTVHVEVRDEAGHDRLSLWLVRGGDLAPKSAGVFGDVAAWPLSLPPPPTYVHAPPPKPLTVDEDGWECAHVAPEDTWFHVFQLRHLVLSGGQLVESDGGFEQASFELGHIPSRILQQLPMDAPEGFVDESVPQSLTGMSEELLSCGDGVGLAMDEQAFSVLERDGSVAPGDRARPFKLILLYKSLFSHLSQRVPES